MPRPLLRGVRWLTAMIVLARTAADYFWSIYIGGEFWAEFKQEMAVGFDLGLEEGESTLAREQTGGLLRKGRLCSVDSAKHHHQDGRWKMPISTLAPCEDWVCC